MAGFNKAFVMGNLTRDPESKQVSGGSSVCNFSVAVNRKYTANGEKKEEVSYFDIEAWGKTGELVMQYLKKGRGVLIEGRLKQDRWETEDGKKMSKIRIVAENVQFLGGSKDEAGSGAPAQQQQTFDDPDIPF